MICEEKANTSMQQSNGKRILVINKRMCFDFIGSNQNAHSTSPYLLSHQDIRARRFASRWTIPHQRGGTL